MENNNNNYSEQDLANVLCILLFKEDLSVKESNNTLCEIINKYTEADYQVPYDSITKCMFDLKSSDDVNKIAQSANERIDAIKNLVNDDDFTNKLKRHINLSKIQKSAILETSEKSKQIANESRKIAKDAVNNVNDFKNIKEKIYTDFISILGIFTAISFTMFGGLQLLGNVFGKLKNYNIHSFGFIIILGAIFLFSMYSLLIVLFTGITKISTINETNKYIINKSILTILLSACLFCIVLGICFIFI